MARNHASSEPVPMSKGGWLPQSRADLPPPDTERWVARRKATVVAGVHQGLITLEEACRRYALSIEEFLAWQQLATDMGLGKPGPSNR